MENEDLGDDKALLAGVEIGVVNGMTTSNDVEETTLKVFELTLISWLSPVFRVV